MKKYFQVKLVNPDNPNGYYMVAIVESTDAVSAVIKAQQEHQTLLATSAEFLCEK